MNTKLLKRIGSLLLCLCMAVGLISTTAFADDVPAPEDQAQEMTVFMGAFETGAEPITTFSNTDTITIVSHMPGLDNLHGVGSLHFVPADGRGQIEMYQDPDPQSSYYEPSAESLYYKDGYVWFVLHGLYELNWMAQFEGGEMKGDQLPPGSYKIRFWAGENMYTSVDTYTVTGSGDVSVTPPAVSDVTPSAETFTDVPTDAYYANAVKWAVDNGITNGTGDTTFSPDRICTQAEIITLLHRTLKNPGGGSSNPYYNAKITSDQYYYESLLWAASQGVVTDMALDPGAPCTRADVVTYMWRAAGSPAATGGSFDDVAADAYYAQAVAWAVAKDITKGTSDKTFSPDVTCTRGQIVTFLHRGENILKWF